MIASLRAVVVLAFVVAGSASTASAATVLIASGDGFGEGFNDPTVVAPVGGNAGTTLGQQRLIAMQFAADIWGAALTSAVPITVNVTFDPLTCSASSAVLGSAGTNTVHADFPGAIEPSTWYVQALANKLAGVDLVPSTADIRARFNSVLGNGCPLPVSWYYGLDASPGGGEIDFVSVALHEIGHGLGFAATTSLSTGEKFLGLDDAYTRRLEDHDLGAYYVDLTDDERVAASTSVSSLHAVGPQVIATSGSLVSGVDANGHVEMYAPDPQQPGSSVSHFSNALSPNDLMEPSYTGPNHSVTLSRALLGDEGWDAPVPTPVATPACLATPAVCRTPAIGNKAQLSIKDTSPDDTKDSLAWKWLKGAATSRAEFGNPTTFTDYRLCVYDGASALVHESSIPAGGLCGSVPCWKSKSSGFQYKNKSRTPEGIEKLQLKQGLNPGQAKVLLAGKGALLGPPAMPLVQPVTVQLKSGNGKCWGAVYSAPATKNLAGPPGQFKDRSDP
jgi:hypothetical protein